MGRVTKQMSTVGNWGSVLLGTSGRLHATGASEIPSYLWGGKGYGAFSPHTGRIKVTGWGSSFELCQPTAGPRRLWRRESTPKQKTEGVCRRGDHEC